MVPVNQPTAAKKKKSKAAVRAAQLRRQGFDTSYVDRGSGYIRVGCSQCEALVISRHPTHEIGCPNAKR